MEANPLDLVVGMEHRFDVVLTPDQYTLFSFCNDRAILAGIEAHAMALLTVQA